VSGDGEFKASTECCACGGGRPPTPITPVGCYDSNTDHTDEASHSCNWYAQSARTQYFCGQFDTASFVASTECCACGGGTGIVPTFAPPPPPREVCEVFDGMCVEKMLQYDDGGRLRDMTEWEAKQYCGSKMSPSHSLPPYGYLCSQSCLRWHEIDKSNGLCCKCGYKKKEQKNGDGYCNIWNLIEDYKQTDCFYI